MARISYSPPQLPISLSRAYTCALLHHGIRHSLSLSKMANSFLRSSPIVSSGHQYVGVRSSSSDYLGFLKSLSFSRIKSSGITRPLQTKRISPVVRATEGENNPGGFHKYRHLWVQCDVCYGLNYKPLFNSKNYICESCGYHVEMSSSDRIDLLIDPGTWVPMDEDMVSTDPLKWDFEEKEEPFQLDLSEWESEFKKVYAELEKRIQLKKEKEKADQEHLNSAAKEKISSEKKEKTDED